MFSFFNNFNFKNIGDKVDLIIKMNENFPHSNKLVLKKKYESVVCYDWKNIKE